MSVLKRYVLIMVFALLAASIFGLSRLSFTDRLQNYRRLVAPIEFDATREKNINVTLSATKKALNNTSYPVDSINRNIFVEKKIVKEEPVFVIDSVKEETIPIVFRGSIVRGNNMIIAQINWANKTYFVKPSETLNNWQIIDITKDKVTIKSAEGKTAVLELNKVTRTAQLIATLTFTPKNQIFQVKKGDEVCGYKVIDIQNDYVIVSKNNSQITISKEPKLS